MEQCEGEADATVAKVNRRQRAVRLTSEGMALLEDATSRRWSDLGNLGRITRDGRAMVLDVSPTTVDRILKGEGVDRSTLAHAFNKLKIEWNDRFCERLTRPDEQPAEDRPVAEHCIETAAPPEDVASPLRAPTGARAVRKFAVLGFAALAVAAAILFVPRLSQKRQPRIQEGWLSEYTLQHDAGVAAYQSGKFELASQQATAAFNTANQQKDSKALAGAFGLQGEILAAQGRLDEAAAKFRTAISLNEQAGYDEGNASLNDLLGSCEARLGHLRVAEQCFERSLRLYTIHDDKGGVSSAARGLGSVAACDGNFELAVKWFASSLAPYVNDDPLPGISLDVKARSAVVKCKKGQHSSALADLTACLKEWSNRRHLRWQAATLLQLGAVYQAMGDNTASENSIKQARRMYRLVGDARGAALCSKQPESLTLAELLFQ